MPVGVFFDGFSSTAEMLEVCREAEQAGATSLWFAQHMGYREAIVWATAAASVTRSRHPGADRHQPLFVAAAAGRNGDLHAWASSPRGA